MTPTLLPPVLMDADKKNLRIALPKFLQLLTSNGLPMSKSMAVAGKVYKHHNTPATLSELNDMTLTSLGVNDQEDRKLILSALRKAGYTLKGASHKAVVKLTPAASDIPPSPLKDNASPRKRKRPTGLVDFIPGEPCGDDANIDNFNFNEVTNEEALKTKFVIINRAPVMMAWATLVAECMYFSRDEALSIASVYTEMNAISKNISLEIYGKAKDRGTDAEVGGSQPYVDLMGRRPLYQTQAGKWRGLSDGKAVPPTNGFSYITRSLRQTTPYIIGALKLLAHSYSLEELKIKAWSLYAEFRPEVSEWGKRSEVYCKTILGLRKSTSRSDVGQELQTAENTKPVIQDEMSTKQSSPLTEGGPQLKKVRALTVEEYEALLDQDTTFDDVDPSSFAVHDFQ